MKQIVEKFDRSYIINLRERPDRRREAIEEFARVGIALPHPKVEFYTAERPTEKGPFASIGQRGVFNSHRDVLRRAIERNLSNVLVFEDDVFFRDVPESEIARMLAELDRQPWDLVYFGYVFPSEDTLTGPLAPCDVLTLGSQFCGINGPFIRYMAQYMDACEQRPLRHRLGGPSSRDGAFNHVRLIDPNVKVLLAAPNLAWQRFSPSDLTPRKIDRVPGLRLIMSTYRNLRNSAKRRRV